MPRYKISLEYDGGSFCGWQRQSDVASVEQTIENALAKLSGKPVSITGCGRTDAGVHALNQIAHFDLEKNFSGYQVMMALNYYLIGSDVVINDCQIVKDNFHSRFDAILRSYQYKILNRRTRSVIMKNRAWHIAKKLNIEDMSRASLFLVGQHDFSSFRDKECQASSPIKTLSHIEIAQNNELITINISAKSFLHHMVRNIVGTLVWVGYGRIKPEEIKAILAARNRNLSGPNAPSYGLYFLGATF